MKNKFIRERHLVELLMQRLGIAAQYVDAMAKVAEETGADVIAVTAKGRIGIQVTELDTGSVAGTARGEERKIARAAAGGPYGTWGQHDPGVVFSAIRRSIARKAAMTPAGAFAEVWLLISCGIPEPGSIGSTFVYTPALKTAALNAETSGLLANSRYVEVFLHSVLGVERALYQWSRQSGSWTKTVQAVPPEIEGPSFFDVMQDAEWLRDPEASARARSRRFCRKFARRNSGMAVEICAPESTR
jgi:hypothetical protein